MNTKRDHSSAEYDLGYLRAGVEVLEKYLLSADIYWTVGANPPRGEPAYPQLTLGGLLLARLRAQARPLNSLQRANLDQLDQEIERIHTEWCVAWENKAAAEFHSRLALWRNFLEEYRMHPAADADRYAYEVSRRVQLDLLQAGARDIPAVEKDLLAGLDRSLQAAFVPGEFIWEAELAAGFPQSQYWYLYGKLRQAAPTK